MPDMAPPTPGAAGDAIAPIDNRIAVLILQHPQEQDHLLGTAQLATACLTHATLRIGLSWPSLAKALGRPADPKRWAILHLGSARPADLPRGREIVALDRRGHPLKDQDAALARLEGIVLFDGTWSQAKTLWWRNPWVLKAQRIVLNPRTPSLYGKLRHEPRREGLSTIEAAGLILAGLEDRPEIETTLRDALGRMLDQYRATSNRP
jgi:DTW domain-containing protein YfiP